MREILAGQQTLMLTRVCQRRLSLFDLAPDGESRMFAGESALSFVKASSL
jgi:hypothetical protein